MALLGVWGCLQDPLESLQVLVYRTAEVPPQERRQKPDRTAELDLGSVGQVRAFGVRYDEPVPEVDLAGWVMEHLGHTGSPGRVTCMVRHVGEHVGRGATDQDAAIDGDDRSTRTIAVLCPLIQNERTHHRRRL
jgi:hypothetical protein